jgi:hypothetical protein
VADAALDQLGLELVERSERRVDLARQVARG